MRDKWSLLVIIIDQCGRATSNVLDFASSHWADTAYEKLMNEPRYIKQVTKLY